MSAAHLRGPFVHIPHPHAGCTGKIPYASRQDAKRANDKRAGKLAPYKCKFCGGWHNTSQGKVAPTFLMPPAP